MEKEINIAAILKDKPQGTKLYDLLYNVDVELDTISTTDTETVVWCTNETDNNTTCHRGYSEFGTIRGCTDGLQILLPSKEMRDWSKFAWKRGDVLVSNDGGTEIIFDKWYDDTYTSFYGKHYFNSEDENNIKYNEDFLCTTERYSLEENNAAQCYINTIEERLVGKLNCETLKIEKSQPEFKDGDIVTITFNWEKILFIFSNQKNCNSYSYYAWLNGSIPTIIESSHPKSDIYTVRLSTETEKQQLFNALAKEGKAWDAEKKQIVDLKPKIELKPFDKVLARNSNTQKWEADLFSFKSDTGLYHCVGFIYNQCIPYEGNEHLLGTTKDVEE